MLERDPPHGICAWPRGDSLTTLEAQIHGPEDSPFAEGVFVLEILIPERYPFEPPKVRFVTPIYHPNIDNCGRICLDSLKMPPKGAWLPSLNVSTLLTTVRLLMASPNPDDGLMPDIVSAGGGVVGGGDGGFVSGGEGVPLRGGARSQFVHQVLASLPGSLFLPSRLPPSRAPALSRRRHSCLYLPHICISACLPAPTPWLHVCMSAFAPLSFWFVPLFLATNTPAVHPAVCRHSLPTTVLIRLPRYLSPFTLWPPLSESDAFFFLILPPPTHTHTYTYARAHTHTLLPLPLPPSPLPTRTHRRASTSRTTRSGSKMRWR